jgi:hypothetical protein
VSPRHGFKGAPEPSRELFIFRVDKSTEIDELKDYLVGKNVKVRELKCVSNSEAKFKSFRLTVPVSDFKNLFDEALWPEGVRVRRFIPPKQ